MAAHAATAPGGPSLTIRGRPYPVLLPKVRDPRLHLAAVITSLQILGQVAFHFSVSISQILISLVTARGAGGRHRGVAAARPALAGERAHHRQQRRVHPPRARDAPRRLVEPERLVDLRGHGRGLAALEARDPGRRPAHLQPVELRPRPLLPPARAGPRRAARLLVGADVAVARARVRDHRRRRQPDPRAPEAARARRRLLVHLRRRGRRARGDGTHDGGALAPRSDHRRVPLVGSADVAGDPRLPLLHDHRPAHDSARAEGARRVRHERRPAGGAADRADADRIRDEGRRPRLAHGRLCRAAAARALPASATRAAGGSRSPAPRRSRSTQAHSSAAGSRGARRRPRPRRPASGPLPQIAILPSKGVDSVLDPKTSRQLASDLVDDLRLQARRSVAAAPRRARPVHRRRGAERAVEPDPRGRGRNDRGAHVSPRPDARAPRGRARSGAGRRRRRARRKDGADARTRTCRRSSCAATPRRRCARRSSSWSSAVAGSSRTCAAAGPLLSCPSSTPSRRASTASGSPTSPRRSGSTSRRTTSASACRTTSTG